MIIGIDVGGTNTDAALMDEGVVVASSKSPTTADVTSGIRAALASIRQDRAFDPATVQGVMIGTTHFVNALVEAQRLAPTAVLRFGLPATSGLPPLIGWPQRIRDAINAQTFLLHGGNEFDGRVISPLDERELRDAVDMAVERGARSVAVSAVYSPVNAEFELQAQERIASWYPDVAVSLSHEIGRVGLLERENAAVINASLRELAAEISDALEKSLRDDGIVAPLFLSQNDGTLMDLAYTRRYPVSTFASGPTNSMRGAAYLSGLSDCLVVDIGGTTSDIGALQGGFPRQAAIEVDVAGIRTNFRMPDVFSIGLGGGSIVSHDRGGTLTVGPRSVGYQITTHARVFGGETLTATDLVVAARQADVGDPTLVQHVEPSDIARGLRAMRSLLETSIDRVRTSAEPVDLVAVGGGSILVPEQLEGARRVYRPEHHAVANAIGAAIAQVGGEVDRIFAVQANQRDEVLNTAKQEATDKAVAAGADPRSVQIMDVDEVPLAYLPGNAVRIRVKAVGDLPLGA